VLSTLHSQYHDIFDSFPWISISNTPKNIPRNQHRMEYRYRWTDTLINHTYNIIIQIVKLYKLCKLFHPKN